MKTLVDSGHVVGGGERPSPVAAVTGRCSAARHNTLVLPGTLQSFSHVLDHGTPTGLGSQQHPKPSSWNTAGKGGVGKVGPFGEAASALFLL